MTDKRNLGRELLEAIQDIQNGKGRRFSVDIPSEADIKRIRNSLMLSQIDFAHLMGVSERTLQEWEQGRRKPSGPACSLLKIAQKHPEIFKHL